MRFAFITRDWKGSYRFKPELFKGMSLYSDENLDTGGDSAALCLLEGETSLTPEELYSIWNRLAAEEGDEKNMISYRRKVGELFVTSWFQGDDYGIVHGRDSSF